MPLEIASTTLLGGLAFWWGLRFGRMLLRHGATANDIFKGKTSLSLAFLGLYMGLLLLALYVPQWQWLPLEWRAAGMRVTWTAMRIMLLGVCGVAAIVSWQTVRIQVLAVALLGLLGMGSFVAAETYVLAPIYSSLEDNLRANGVFQQTSASSCAPSAMATVLRRWGIAATESSVAKFAGTSRLGTSMPQLIVAARRLGMDGMELTDTTWEQMQRMNRPGVLASWAFDRNGQKSPHAIALLALTRDTATIADPAWGKIYRLNRSQFAHIWRREYVPFFQPEEAILSTTQVREYLTRLGYLKSPQSSLTRALQRFQAIAGLQASGTLDSQTALLLSGPFLKDVPTLNHPQ